MFPHEIPCNECPDCRELKKGNIFTQVNGMKLLIIDMPHYYCYNCNSIAFPNPDYMSSAIKHAVFNQYNLILWEN